MRSKQISFSTRFDGITIFKIFFSDELYFIRCRFKKDSYIFGYCYYIFECDYLLVEVISFFKCKMVFGGVKKGYRFG